MSGQIGQIGWKSIEMMPGQIQPVELGRNPLRLHCMPAWLNWVVALVGNHLDYIVCLPGQIG